MQEALDAARKSDAVIFIGGTTHAYDKECLGYYNPPNADKPDLELPCGQATFLTKLAQANPRTAVVLVNGSPVSVEPWADQVPAILEAWYGGQEAGTAIAHVLFGAAEAGGRLSCTFGRQLGDYACHANGSYPGDRDPAFAQTNYLEGVFIGYRHFDRNGIEPRPYQLMGYLKEYLLLFHQLNKECIHGHERYLLNLNMLQLFDPYFHFIEV